MQSQVPKNEYGVTGALLLFNVFPPAVYREAGFRSLHKLLTDYYHQIVGHIQSVSLIFTWNQALRIHGG